MLAYVLSLSSMTVVKVNTECVFIGHRDDCVMLCSNKYVFFLAFLAKKKKMILCPYFSILV